MLAADIPQEFILQYIERRKTDLEICEHALQSKDFDVMARVGHQIKGNAASFGFNDLGHIAIDMETYALKQDEQNLQKVMNRFHYFLDRH
ncbi:MAG: Hpt domain-containing protein [Bdellovibrionaceae bacterium]|nr:Hpt domain-containing protein [Pseudobdellovibrionaceae bacterium]